MPNNIAVPFSDNLRAGAAGVDTARILEALPQAILAVDASFAIRYVNMKAEEFFYASAATLQGAELSELIPADSPVFTLIRQVLRTAAPVVDHGLILDSRRMGQRDVLIQATPLGDPPDLAIVAFQERSIAERLDQQWNQRGAVRSAQAMAAMLGHEVRNPLAGIRGAAQLLEREYPDSEHREYTRVIIREADRLQNLVDRLLGPNRLPQKADVNVHLILEHVRQLVEAEAPPGIVVLRDYDPSIPEVHADREQLIQATLNVSRNALQALGTKGSGMIVLRTRTRRQITIGGRRHKLAIQVDIEDNGPGIAPTMMEKIFYPMVTTRAEGTGLGLPIAQYLIHSHGGLIECQSQPGRTVFSMFLPLGESS